MAGQPDQDRTWTKPDFRGLLENAGKIPKRPKKNKAAKEPQRHYDERPNVLWLMADQWRGDMLGCLGHPAVQTPNLDKLAAKGVAFSRTYCTSPVCLPSRASFFTGLSLPHHQALTNGMPMKKDTPCFTNLLKEAGYRTANIGKHHAGVSAQHCWEYLDNSPDAFGATAPRNVAFDPNNYPELTFIADEVCDNSDRVLYGTYPGPVPTTKSYRLTTQAMRWLYYHDDPRPFFLRVSYDDPHPPVVPPPPFDKMYDPAGVPADLIEGAKESFANKTWTVQTYAEQKGVTKITEAQHREHIARYMGLCSHLDAQIGRLLDYLEEIGYADNTLVVFNSDHGHMIGEHGLTHKHYVLYEGVNRIPFIMRWPGKLPENSINNALIDGCDFAPTMMDALHVDGLGEVDGQSVLPLARGECDTINDYVVCQYDDFCFSIVEERFKLIRYDSDDESVGEFYDLENDPYEKQNLWNDPRVSDAQARLDQALNAWRTKHGATSQRV